MKRKGRWVMDRREEGKEEREERGGREEGEGCIHICHYTVRFIEQLTFALDTHTQRERKDTEGLIDR